MPDKCHCVDFQVLKLQELTDGVPQGEIPRHITLFCDRYLCEKVVPGNRVFVLGIYSIKKAAKPSKASFLLFLELLCNSCLYSMMAGKRLSLVLGLHICVLLGFK